MINKLIFLTLIATAASCLTEANPPPDQGASQNSVAAPSGDRQLGLTTYADSCAVCHDPIATSAKAGATYARILGAGSVAAHAGVSPWPDEQSSANLAAALAPAGGDPTNGATLYAASCASCHQPLASTQKPNRSAEIIINAADIPPHASVTPWPNATDSADIAAALAQ